MHGDIEFQHNISIDLGVFLIVGLKLETSARDIQISKLGVWHLGNIMKSTIALVFISLLLLFTNALTQAQSADASTAAKVIFYRSSNDGGKAYSLTSQNKELAKLKKGGQFEQLIATPGTYYYMADPSTKQVFKLDVAAGQTYYVLASKDGSFFNGKPTLQISTAQAYRQAVANN